MEEPSSMTRSGPGHTTGGLVLRLEGQVSVAAHVQDGEVLQHLVEALQVEPLDVERERLTVPGEQRVDDRPVRVTRDHAGVLEEAGVLTGPVWPRLMTSSAARMP